MLVRASSDARRLPTRHDAVIGQGRNVLKWPWAAESWPGADVVGLRRMLRPQGAEEQREAGVICLRAGAETRAEAGAASPKGLAPDGTCGSF